MPNFYYRTWNKDNVAGRSPAANNTYAGSPTGHGAYDRRGKPQDKRGPDPDRTLNFRTANWPVVGQDADESLGVRSPKQSPKKFSLK